jgi:hypothetical protein
MQAIQAIKNVFRQPKQVLAAENPFAAPDRATQRRAFRFSDRPGRLPQSSIRIRMAQVSSSTFSKFQLVASEFRRDCANVDARMTRLESLRAETDKMIAQSNLRIARCLTALDRSPSINETIAAGSATAHCLAHA